MTAILSFVKKFPAIYGNHNHKYYCVHKNPAELLGREFVSEKQVTQPNINHSKHWPTKSYKEYCHMCLAQG